MNVINRPHSEEELIEREIFEGMCWAMVDYKHIFCGPWNYPLPSDSDYYATLLEHDAHPFMDRPKIYG